MHGTQPFNLHIFVVDGDPDGLRIVERSNWNGKAVVFPRALYPKIKARPEFSETGVYLLAGPREDGNGEMLYIGEGDPVRPRIDSHFAKKDFWTRAVFFVGAGKLNKAHVQFLEAQLIRFATAAKRMHLDNGNEPTDPSLSESDRAVLEVFLQHMLGILPILSIHAFEQTPSSGGGFVGPASAGASDEPMLLSCGGKGVTASGFESTQGFVVKAGSQAVPLSGEAPSLQVHVGSVFKTRRELLNNGVLKQVGERLVFTKDFVFNSPSLASATILGRSSNGRVEWKDSTGKTLKELQVEQTKPLPVP
ncbi:DUF4357 domain-containing protein [Opitutaceae bacterium EW11]|nr:DUF4357 domain-containing protein [Opitutaceae bacterium EW11]